jgi:hypothetical protein
VQTRDHSWYLRLANAVECTTEEAGPSRVSVSLPRLDVSTCVMRRSAFELYSYNPSQEIWDASDDRIEKPNVDQRGEWLRAITSEIKDHIVLVRPIM